MLILYNLLRLSMQTTLKITTVFLDPIENAARMFDMTGRCAFAVCTKGEFTIKILNEQYIVNDQCMFACMPFVNIEVISVFKPSEIIFGSIIIEDVPRLIYRWINTNNLITIQNWPLVKITDTHFRRLNASINEYLNECAECQSSIYENICNQLQRDIIDFQSRLIVAQVLKIYFINIPMEVSSHTHRDGIFQRFMIDLYTNCHEQRSVKFYALRSAVSLKYFSTIIRQLSGTSPSEWIETVVVGEAKSMLNDINRSIKDIATTLNFPDAPTFTKYFHRVTGMTPKAYRKKLL